MALAPRVMSWKLLRGTRYSPPSSPPIHFSTHPSPNTHTPTSLHSTSPYPPLLHVAAGLDNVQSMCNLASCYEHGLGVVRSARAAFQWYLKSAQNDYPEGAFHTALCFAKGLHVKPDIEIARTWFFKAAKLGYGPGAIALNDIEKGLKNVYMRV